MVKVSDNYFLVKTSELGITQERDSGADGKTSLTIQANQNAPASVGLLESGGVDTFNYKIETDLYIENRRNAPGFGLVEKTQDSGPERIEFLVACGESYSSGSDIAHIVREKDSNGNITWSKNELENGPSRFYNDDKWLTTTMEIREASSGEFLNFVMDGNSASLSIDTFDWVSTFSASSKICLSGFYNNDVNSDGIIYYDSTKWYY